MFTEPTQLITNVVITHFGREQISV